MSKQQRGTIDQMLRQPRPEGPQTVAAMRARFAAMMATMIVPDQIRTATVTLGARPALLVEPTDGVRPGTILYFHGGGNVFGSPEASLSLTGNLVARTGLRAFSLDYRLAPEHPFPAGAEDALSAYRALLDSGEDPSAIALPGIPAAAATPSRPASLPATRGSRCPPRSWRSPPGSTTP
jgi:epsilon-lactone hydrolase